MMLLISEILCNFVSLSNEQIAALDGEYLYHSGSGTMYQWVEADNNMESKAGSYSCIIGAINRINDGQVHAGSSNLSLLQNPNYSGGFGADVNNPLPNGIRGGDSGSPTFIYNAQTKQYI